MKARTFGTALAQLEQPPLGDTPEAAHLPASVRRNIRILRVFDLADRANEVAMYYEDEALAFEKAARAAQETARLYEQAAHKARAAAREMQKVMGDIARDLREMACEAVDKAERQQQETDE